MTLRLVPHGNLGFEHIDQHQGTAELMMCKGRPIEGAALREALRVGYEQLALAEICVHLDPAGSGRIHEEVGFRRDPAGELHDLVRLSLREPDWRAAHGLGPKVVLMQPQFLPWLGYLELIQRADVFVFLDDFQFLRRSWGQRNRLFVVRGKVGMVTLPVVHEDNQEATFLDLREAESAVWRRKLLNLLHQNYSSTPHGEAVLSLVSDWFAGSYANLADLEIAFIEKIAGYLGLHTRFVRSSTLGITGLRRSWRLQAILEKLSAGTYVSAHGSFPYMKEDGVFPLASLPVYFQNHTPREYPQHASEDFVPRLSCLDALANLPPHEVRNRLRGTDWWQNWEEREAEENAAPGS
jgi:hypothetical protein